MASLNERNSQILGLLGIMGGAFRDNKFGDGKPKGAHADKQKLFYEKSEEARIAIRKYGIEKPSLTYVGMSPPAMFTRAQAIPDVQKVVEQITFRAERVNQPGIQLLTNGIRRYGVGQIEKKPYASATPDINISFVGDAKGVVHQFFYIWMNGIINSYNLPDGAGVPDMFGKLPSEVEYRVNYRTPIDFYMYDEERLEVNKIRLHNAFPIAVGDIQRDWAGINDLVRVNVTFTYSHWSYMNDGLLSIVEPDNKTLAEDKKSLLDSALKGMTALQTITAIKRPQNVNDILNVVNTGSTLLSSFMGRGITY